MARTLGLGPFDLLAPIGRGGAGVVWRAAHRGKRVEVAVKLLARAQSSDAIEEFRSEVRAVAGLDHPGVVVVYDHGVVAPEEAERSEGRLAAGSPWLAMELLEGGALHPWCGQLRWPAVRRTLLVLLDALAHAHARGLVHRDVKPQNVLLGAGGRVDGPDVASVKLSDFGLAHALARTAEEGDERWCGTPSFMAPEQVDGTVRDHGPWTDLYALGCLGWALAAGEPPFWKLIGWIDARVHLVRDPPPLESATAVPDGFEEWLRKLLAKDPARRFRWAADAAWALLPLQEEPVWPDESAVALSAVPRTFDEAVAIPGAESADPLEFSHALRDLAVNAQQAGRGPETREWAARAIAMVATHGFRSLGGSMHVILGDLDRTEGDLGSAEAHYREALAIFDDTGTAGVGPVRLNLALIHLARSRFAEARLEARLAERDFVRMGQTRWVSVAALCLLPSAAAAGDWMEWDRRWESVEPALGRGDFIDSDIAHMARIAGEIALAAGERQRARRALALSIVGRLKAARGNGRRVGRPLGPDRHGHHGTPSGPPPERVALA